MFSGERLKELRKNKGYTQLDIANQLGINRASYSSWEVGRAKPNQSNLKRLGLILGVDSAYFESEFEIVTNYLRLNSVNKKSANEFVKELLTSQNELSEKIIPFYPIQVLENVPLSAGFGESFYDEYSYKTVYSDTEYNYDFASFIKGQSMEPMYLDGEVALFSESGFDYDGAVYAISLNGKAYIKRLYRENDRYRIVSFNPDYPDMFADENDDFRIVGKVIGHFKPIENNGV
ncbi:HTH-type transcriptional regulator rdgA [Streptococcus dysgalactiae subsp. dysgalactiae]|uniref:HTH-type transcriptional regulator rdgA n=1 Tax=Streptococcus dysgalactiae subsp. dysgalactiae TaxID=99822 RepID=A0A380JU85_STRDY|nr:XRE family transcriptional regulator [Streptococcus dysgalactiae]SUN48781.1 HTH-type transcriptional regulator rdgA [Streptococcus dysgalactiae subsp. dysgalactiae]